MNQNQNQNQMQLKGEDKVLQGKYTNMMQVSHTKEEFVMDFILVHPPIGQLISRVITSPGHMKRIVSALKENLKKYEDIHGEIEIANEPKQKIGFNV